MKKNIFLLAICVLLFSGCGEKVSVPKETQIDLSNIPQIVIEERLDPVIGFWEAKAMLYDGKVVSFSDNEVLAELYDTQWITFEPDSFSLQNGVFTISGQWERTSLEDIENIYLLHKKTSSRFSMIDGEVKEVINETEGIKIAYILNDDENLLVITDMDSDDSAFLYVREGTSSAVVEESSVYYSNNKNDNVNSSSSNNGKGSGATTGEKNALESAKSYLSFTAFSKSGLIEQLEYEGYTYSEAKYAVDNCGADWYEQAALSAKRYLDFTSFSRSGLIEQLEYEGFTTEQAEYAVNKVY